MFSYAHDAIVWDGGKLLQRRNSMIKASCTWGEGPDVLVSFDRDASAAIGSRVNTQFILYEDPIKRIPGRPRTAGYKHGFVETGSFDLTADQAITLANELLAAAQFSKELEASLIAYEQASAKKCKDRGDAGVCVRQSDAESLVVCSPSACNKEVNNDEGHI